MRWMDGEEGRSRRREGEREGGIVILPLLFVGMAVSISSSPICSATIT